MESHEVTSRSDQFSFIIEVEWRKWKSFRKSCSTCSLGPAVQRSQKNQSGRHNETPKLSSIFDRWLSVVCKYEKLERVCYIESSVDDPWTSYALGPFECYIKLAPKSRLIDVSSNQKNEGETLTGPRSTNILWFPSAEPIMSSTGPIICIFYCLFVWLCWFCLFVTNSRNVAPTKNVPTLSSFPFLQSTECLSCQRIRDCRGIDRSADRNFMTFHIILRLRCVTVSSIWCNE